MVSKKLVLIAISTHTNNFSGGYPSKFTKYNLLNHQKKFHAFIRRVTIFSIRALTKSGNCFTCLTHIPSTPGYSSSCLVSSVIHLIQATLGSPERQYDLLTLLTHLGYSSHVIISNSSNPSGAPSHSSQALFVSSGGGLLTYPAHLGIFLYPQAQILSV